MIQATGPWYWKSYDSPSPNCFFEFTNHYEPRHPASKMQLVMCGYWNLIPSPKVPVMYFLALERKGILETRLQRLNFLISFLIYQFFLSFSFYCAEPWTSLFFQLFGLFHFLFLLISLSQSLWFLFLHVFFFSLETNFLLASSFSDFSEKVLDKQRQVTVNFFSLNSQASLHRNGG